MESYTLAQYCTSNLTLLGINFNTNLNCYKQGNKNNYLHFKSNRNKTYQTAVYYIPVLNNRLPLATVVGDVRLVTALEDCTGNQRESSDWGLGLELGDVDVVLYGHL